MTTSASIHEIGSHTPVEHASSLWTVIGAALAIGGIALIVALSIWMQNPHERPSAKGNLQFSVDRALIDVNTISQNPHPIGSDEHRKVETYLLNKVRQMALVPEIQTGSVVTEGGDGSAIGANVSNILVRLPGTGASKSILLVAHYDTVPTSGGAADDSANVAAILEILRAIQAGPRLKHDVVALFTDGEEVGLLGSREFVKDRSRIDDIGLVINMEARGNRGASLMFETSPNNGWLITQIGQSSARPVTSSLMYEVYRRMPNGTDLTIFKHADLPGLNFAFIEGSTSYHAASDNPARLDRDSLQDQGDSVLALVRHFGILETLDKRSANEIFFDAPGRLFVHYSKEWNILFVLGATAWLLALMVQKLRSKQAAWTGIALGLLYLSASVILSYCIAWATTSAVQSAGFQRQFAMNYVAGRYNLGLVAWSLAVCCGLYCWFRKRVSLWSMLLGSLTACALLMAVTAWWMPGVSYIFTLPLLACLFSATALASHGSATRRIFQRSAGLIGLIGILFLVAPTIRLVLIGVGLTLSKVIIISVALFGVIVIFLIEFIGVRSIGTVGAMAGVIGMLMVLWGVAGTHDSVLNPNVNSVFYLADPARNRATWASLDTKPDPWTAQFLTTKPRVGDLKDYRPDMAARYLQNPAPVGSWPVPQVELLSNVDNGDGRTVRLRLRSMRGAAIVAVYLDPHVARGITVEGELLSKPSGTHRGLEANILSIEYYNPPADGIDVTIKTAPGAALRGTMVDRSYGLPWSLVSTLPARPDTTIPRPSKLSDTTQVSAQFQF